MQKGNLIRVDDDGTAFVLTKIDPYYYEKRQVRECYIDWIDSRPLSDKQRRMCYSLINAIAEWSGSTPNDIKEAFKMEFWAERVETLADKVFSLSNAPMSLVAAFQKFLIGFILENDVPLKFSLLDYVVASSGNYAQLASSGNYAKVDGKGKYAVICCAGSNSAARGKIGSWITLSEWEWNDEEDAYIPVCVKTERIDGVKIKEDTFYKLENGEFVEVE